MSFASRGDGFGDLHAAGSHVVNRRCTSLEYARFPGFVDAETGSVQERGGHLWYDAVFCNAGKRFMI